MNRREKYLNQIPEGQPTKKSKKKQVLKNNKTIVALNYRLFWPFPGETGKLLNMPVYLCPEVNICAHPFSRDGRINPLWR